MPAVQAEVPRSSEADRDTAIVLVVALALFAAVFGLRLVVEEPLAGVSLLYTLPIALVAARLGARAGLLVGLVALGLFFLYAELKHLELSLVGYATRGAAFLVVGGLLGGVADRLRSAEDRLGDQAKSLTALVRRIESTALGAAAQPRADGDPAGTRRDVSLLWKVLVPNLLVLLCTALALVLSPIPIGSAAAVDEALVLACGVGGLLLVNFALMRRTFGPLERLTTLMRRVDPLEPGRRIAAEGQTSEVAELGQAFNEMLDRLERERRESALRALSTQESDRRRFARELHDELGQVLTALLLQLKRTADGAPSELHSQLLDAQETTRSALADVRRIVGELRPEALDDLGLVSALSSLAAGFSDRTGMRVRLQLDREVCALGPEAELVVYRVAQEGLTNAARHSGVGEVAVSLERRGDRTRLTIHDRGRGKTPSSPNGSGVRGMRERALAVGADLVIDSQSGAGTKVTLDLPRRGANG